MAMQSGGRPNLADARYDLVDCMLCTRKDVVRKRVEGEEECVVY
jgi:hypothetical protein